MAQICNKTENLELTDFKYQNYQSEIKSLIEGLEDSCMRYNQILISKKIFSESIIYSWLIILPDRNLQPISISDYNDKIKTGY